MNKIFTGLSIVGVILLTSCSQKEKKISNFDFNTIDNIVKEYDLKEALDFIEQQKGLKTEDSLKLVKYNSFITTLNAINNKLNTKDKEVFISSVIDFQNGVYDNKVLYLDKENIYEGNTFLNANVLLVKSDFWKQSPKDLMITCSYDDKYFNHIFTDISIVSEKQKIKLNKNIPANGFNDIGGLKTRPFKFKLTKKQIELIINSKQSKFVLTTAKTYKDRAYLNGTIWDINGGETISYNDIETFKERKSQILEKGEVKQFEIVVKPKFKDRLIQLYQIHNILKRNNI